MSPGGFAESRSRQAAVAAAMTLLVAGGWLALPHPAVAVALALLPIAILIGLRIPFALCLAFVVFSFFRVHEAIPALMPLRIPQLLAVATLGVLGWNLFIARNVDAWWSKELGAFVAFFVLVTLGLPLAANRALAMDYWVDTYVKIAVMVFAIAWLTRTPAELGRAARIFIAAGLLIAGVTLFNQAEGIGLVEGTRVTIGRDIGSLLGDPNDLSLVLLFPMSFAVGLAATRGIPGFTRALALLALLAMIAAVIATQSRGGLLGTVAVLGIAGAQRIKSKALLATIGIVGLLGLFAVAGISDRSSGGAAEELIDESAMGRIYAWQAAFNMAVERPLSGVGLNNFVANYFFFSPHWDGNNHAVHSTWFGVLGETGFPGLIAFGLMVGITLASARRSAARLMAVAAPADAQAMALAVLAGLTGFCVSGTFLTQGFTWPVYIQLALAAAVSRIAGQLEAQSRARIADCERNCHATPKNTAFSTNSGATGFGISPAMTSPSDLQN